MKIKSRTMYDVYKVANKILAYSVNSGDDYISNLKLQKLLYYMQGFHIAMFKEPLFNEEIEAWQYGPVVPCVYSHYSKFGSKGIEPEEDVLEFVDIKEEILFEEVFRVYGHFSAIGLMNMTHKEKPWLTTPIGIGNVISKDKLMSFFKKRIK